MLIKVQGGTDAGRRVIREAARPWVHHCPPLGQERVCDAGDKRCPYCGTKRP